MKTLPASIETNVSSDQPSFTELYDFYLRKPIQTPHGLKSIIRLTSLGIDFSFFAPTHSPEPIASQGQAEMYYSWPLVREIVKGSSQFTNDKLAIGASNVTREFAQMLDDVNWYDTPVVIRHVSLKVAAPTAADCVTFYSGLVDSAGVTLEQLEFIVSNDMGALEAILPRENMHTNCRHKYGDDLCTQVPFLPENYKAGTVGVGSSLTVIKSADFTEDTGTSAGYGTDLVDALADANITASSELAYTNVAIQSRDSNDYFEHANHKLSTGEEVVFSSAPDPLVDGTSYYTIWLSKDAYRVSATPGGPALTIDDSIFGVLVTTPVGFRAKNVKASAANYWKMGDDADWGTLTQGYWSIPDAQAGLANAELKPWIQFDFGTAKTPRVWRVSSVPNVKLEELVRLIVFFSSTDNATWKFESYYEMPAKGGVLYDVLIPKASTARYWRICIRSRWAESLYYSLLNKVHAYEGSRHWWAFGTIKFADDTTTATLRGVSRRILRSFSGEVVVQALPAVPAAGDTFIVRRGCPLTFNGCAARRNTENFGGHLDLPNQTVIR